MGKRGPAPLPTKLHILHGNPGKRRLPENEPEPEIKIPDPLTILHGVALEEWNRITQELFKLGLIAEINRSTLGAYCKAYGDWIEAEEHYDKAEKLYFTDKGYPVFTPWRSVADKAFERMHRAATGFGLDPASMSRIRGMGNGGKKENQQGAKRFLA